MIMEVILVISIIFVVFRLFLIVFVNLWLERLILWEKIFL